MASPIVSGALYNIGTPNGNPISFLNVNNGANPRMLCVISPTCTFLPTYSATIVAGPQAGFNADNKFVVVGEVGSASVRIVNVTNGVVCVAFLVNFILKR